MVSVYIDDRPLVFRDYKYTPPSTLSVYFSIYCCMVLREVYNKKYLKSLSVKISIFCLLPSINIKSCHSAKKNIIYVENMVVGMDGGPIGKQE